MKETLRRDLDFMDVGWLSFSDIKDKKPSQKTPSKEKNQLDACLVDERGDRGKQRITVHDPELFRWAERSDYRKDRLYIDRANGDYMLADDAVSIFKKFKGFPVSIVYLNKSNVASIEKLGIKSFAQEIKDLREEYSLSTGSDNVPLVEAVVLKRKGDSRWSTSSSDSLVRKMWKAHSYGIQEALDHCECVLKPLDGKDEEFSIDYLSRMVELHGLDVLRTSLKASEVRMEEVLDKIHKDYPLLGLYEAHENDKIAYVEMINEIKTQKGEAQ